VPLVGGEHHFVYNARAIPRIDGANRRGARQDRHCPS
jgi:hypothetical protein